VAQHQIPTLVWVKQVAKNLRVDLNYVVAILDEPNIIVSPSLLAIELKKWLLFADGLAFG
jgi:hypothetical protein